MAERNTRWCNDCEVEARLQSTAVTNFSRFLSTLMRLSLDGSEDGFGTTSFGVRDSSLDAGQMSVTPSRLQQQSSTTVFEQWLGTFRQESNARNVVD